MTSSAASQISAHQAGVPVTLTIKGREYNVSCPKGEEKRLQTLAALVDARMMGLARLHPYASDSHLLVLIALMMADELEESRIANPQMMREREVAYHDEEELLVAAVNHLRDRLISLADSLRET